MSNDIFHPSPSAPYPSTAIHLPNAYERFGNKQRNSWLDSLLDTIEAKKKPPVPASPSRSPSPISEDDVFGQGVEEGGSGAGTTSIANEEDEQDEMEGDDLFGEDLPEGAEEYGADIDGGMMEEVDGLAPGFLSASMVHEALRNAGQYSGQVDDADADGFDAEMNEAVDDSYIDRDQAYSGSGYVNGDFDQQAGQEAALGDVVDAEDDYSFDGEVAGQEELDDETRGSNAGVILETYDDDEEEEYDDDDGFGDPLPAQDEVIEIGDTDDEEEAEEDCDGEGSDDEDQSAQYDDEEEEDEEMVESERSEDEEAVEEVEGEQSSDQDQAIYGYDEVPALGTGDVPYSSSNIFDALDQNGILSTGDFAATGQDDFLGPYDTAQAHEGSTLLPDQDQEVPSAPTFDPFRFDSAAVDQHNAERNLYPAIPTDVADDLQAIMSQPTSVSQVEDAQIDPALQELFETPMRDADTASIYPALPLPPVESATAAEATISQPPSLDFGMPHFNTLEDTGIDVPGPTSATEGDQGKEAEAEEDQDAPEEVEQPEEEEQPEEVEQPEDEEEEEEEEEGPLFEDSTVPRFSSRPMDDVIEVLSSDGEHEDADMEAEQEDHAGTRPNIADSASQGSAVEEAEVMGEDDVVAGPEPAERAASATKEELAERVGESSVPVVEQPAAFPMTATSPPPQSPAEVSAQSPSENVISVDIDVEDERTPEPVDPLWNVSSSLATGPAAAEDPIALPLNEVLVEELADRAPAGLDEMVRQAIEAVQPEVAEPITAQNTPAVDDGLNIAEFFASNQGEPTEIVEEESIVVETGVVETPGLAGPSSAFSSVFGASDVPSSNAMETVTEEEEIVMETEIAEEPEPDTAVPAGDPDTDAHEGIAVPETALESQESAEGPVQVVETVETIETAENVDLAETIDIESPDSPVDDTEAIKPGVDAASALETATADAAAGPAAVGEDTQTTASPGRVPSALTEIGDEEITVVQPMQRLPRADIDRTRLSPIASTSQAPRPRSASGRSSRSPIMPIPILLRSPVNTPPASEGVFDFDNQASVPVFESEPARSRETTPVFPDPHAMVPDTDVPPALSPGEHPQSQLTRSPSMVVEPPLHPPQPENVPAPEAFEREDTPTELPDPTLPAPDAFVPSPLSPGDALDRLDRSTRSPSLIVEPPEQPPAPEAIDEVVTREPTPVDLPDPYAAPPDSTSVAPLSPHHMEVDESTPTPSIIVQPPAEPTTPFEPLSAGGTRENSPPVLPDPHVASPDVGSRGQAVLDEVPRMAERAGSLAPSVKAVNEEDTAMGTESDSRSETAEQETADQESAEQETAEDESTPILPPVHDVAGTSETDETTEAKPPIIDDDETKSHTSDKTETGEPQAPQTTDRPPLYQTESMRLRHHHGGPPRIPSTAAMNDNEAEPAHTAAQTHRRTRSTARSSTSTAPAVTRSHCFYRKLKLQGNGMSALVLVPQCTLYEAERLEEETSTDLGEATADEEREAQPRAMSEEHPILHPHLALKLHRIVGKAIFDEGHCFLLSADEKALKPARSAEILTVGSHSNTPKRVKKRDSEEGDEVESAPKSLTRSVKRQSMARDIKAESSGMLSTPTKAPLSRTRGLRSASKISDAKSEAGEGEADVSPVKKPLRSMRRSISVAGTSTGSLEDAGDLLPSTQEEEEVEEKQEREETPVAVVVTTTPARTRRGRKSGTQSSVEETTEDTSQDPSDAVGNDMPEGQEEEADDTALTPTRKSPSTPSVPAPRSSNRRFAAQAQDDAPYRPIEAELEEEIVADRQDDDIKVQVVITTPARQRRRAEAETEAGLDTVAASVTQQQTPSQKAKKGRKTVGESSNLGRRKSTRLNAKAKEDEATYRPDEEGSQAAESVTDGASVSSEGTAEPVLAKGKGTKRKARDSVMPAAEEDGAASAEEEETQTARVTRSNKRRANSNAEEYDAPKSEEEEQKPSSGVTVEQDEEESADAEDRKVKKRKTEESPAKKEKKGGSWWSLLGRRKK